MFTAPADVFFSPKRVVQPDVFVLSDADGRDPGSIGDANRLLLAVEVVSPATARADRVVKRTLYRDEGVAECWIVDLDSRTFERSTPADPRVEVIDARLEWLPDGASAPLVVDVTAYAADVLEP